MATISGISTQSTGTSIDVNSIVSQLMQAEQTPVKRLDTQVASYQAQLTAYGSLQGAVSGLQSAVSGLASASSLLALKAAPSDTSVLSATAFTTATPGNYSIEVTTLAQQQKLVATGQTSVSTAIGTGTLSFDFGTIDIGTGSFNSTTGKYTGAGFASSGAAAKTVAIDSSNHTLSGIRDAINAANIGVTASIVNDGGTAPYRLVLTSGSTGSASSVRISGGDAGLSALLAHDPSTAPGSGTQNLSESLTARDAQLKVDGLAVTKASNSISDVIPGVTLNLVKPNKDAPINLAVGRDTASVQSAVKGFVDGYNAFVKSIKGLTGYDATAGKAGPLQGDPTARNIDTSVRRILSAGVAGAGGYTSLSQLGVSFQKDGTLALALGKLQSAITTSAADVAAVFAQTGRTSDSLISYTASSSATKPGIHAVSISRLAAQGTAVGSDPVADLTIIKDTNDAVTVSLDGVTATVTLTAKAYASAGALALELQSQINGNAAFSAAGNTVTASSSGGVITLTSNRYGSTSSVSVTGGSGADNLLGASRTQTDGVDVAGTIGALAATGTGQTLKGATGSDADGLQVLVAGGATGSRGTVSYSQGVAYQLKQLAGNFLDPHGSLANRTDGINSSIKDIGKRRDMLNARLAIIEQNYRQQFTALDAMLSSMNQTSTYLTQQLDNLPGFYTSSSKG